ncbi:fumarylacetoacetate hydrolase family protein [Pimelobacter simplex]|uniref:fumarylacetoacetate hydrolase family protein n=1 Tax=Nocardioides simplex TaxID=2045 RepID=UPI003AB0AE3A
MRIAHHEDRAVLVSPDGTTAADLATASAGLFDADPALLYPRWPELVAWYDEWEPVWDIPVRREALGCPSPRPRQIFAIGLNYAAHADETGLGRPEGLPPVFTKFASSLTGADVVVDLPEGDIDWEVEVVAILGYGGRDLTKADAWSAVAGLSVGQDLSERARQLAGPAPQFSLWKSFAGFAPVGPWLVTPDELVNPDDLRLSCTVNDEVVQDGRTRHLISSIPSTIAELSRVVELYPGDVIFTGTPDGVGMGRTPPRYLAAGDVLVSRVEGIGEIRQVLR